ncbi:MAG: hypothetical protein COT74_12365 [Bdellovibrionales bacterium CG10_big_fil_rev_8_21_14_0_10_45_34]|nr:MAG: hypothetical protein COT74_12365 [Bdellovibrionales bacterium CG10_big_fil_rev_8_21_14_0_10_45_34]
MKNLNLSVLKGILLLLILIVVQSLVSGGWVRPKIETHFFRDRLLEICVLVEDHFYSQDIQLSKWTQDCKLEAALIAGPMVMPDFVGLIQDLLVRMNVSHLEIYDPTATRQLLQSESLETGIRTQSADDRYFVRALVEQSPAKQVGIQVGDEILSINAQKITADWMARVTEGEFRVLRKSKEHIYHISVEPIYLDESPEVIEYSPQVAYLRIPSFLPGYFDKDKWIETAQKFTEFENLIIDLRGNLGGDFVAMLRGLSPFFCKPFHVGSLTQPRKTKGEQTVLNDDFDVSTQVLLKGDFTKINLFTFSGYPCYRGRVHILVDDQTASSAEIFSQAMSERPGVRLFGTQTSGSVLLGVLYPLDIGRGWILSIPQAVYENPDGFRIEGEGIKPDKQLGYDVESLIEGIDPWVEEAISSF